MAFGGVRIDEAMKAASADQRVEQLAELGNAATRLAYTMEDERDLLAGYIATGRHNRAQLSAIETQYHTTSQAAARVSALASAIGPSFSPQVQDDAAAVVDRINDLPQIRIAATKTDIPALTIITDYSDAISDLFALNDKIANGSGDATLSNTVSALGALSRAEDDASQQRGILYLGLLVGHFPPDGAAALTNAEAQQQAELAEFNSDASLGEQQIYNDTVTGPEVDVGQAMELQAIASGSNGGNIVVSGTPSTWYSDMSFTLDKTRSVERGLVDSVIRQSNSLHAQLTRTALETGIEVLAVLIVVLMITIVVARSMVRPLRKLRTGALEVAGLRLPETVRRMSETDGEGVSLEVEPIDVDSSDEIGEVARAFDQVHREALRLAANEAALRGNVNAMFVNLSRRSQSLVERQIRLIDDLEQGEQDPERLSSLFQMDHLATRMRRNSENLLVLAGHDESRRWNQPVALVDVLRAALSEIEQYERVTLNVQPGIAVRGQAVSDVVHLTAELVENATSFSAAETPVTIAGHLLSSGGVLLEITDQGVGMGAEEMAHANWRLDNPPVVDVAVSRRMGLFVVARLAARHGIRVRLRPAASGGLIALVWLPDESIMHETPDGTPTGRRDPMTEPAIGPVSDGTFAGAGAGTNGGMTSGWGDAGLSATEQEVNAARTPRFAPLRADAEETSGRLGPKRVPGAGPRPGAGWAATGPLPVFRTVPRPAGESGPQPTVTGPQPGAEPETAQPEAASADAPATAFDFGGTTDFGSSTSEFASQPDFGSSTSEFASQPDPGSKQPAGDGNGAESLRTSPHPVLGAPAAGWDTGSSRSGVIVPPADGNGEEHRLPIFEAVESDWFRRGRQAVGRPTAEAEPGNGNGGNGWTSPVDAGWAAAEAVHTPSSGGVTSAGLPKRVPQANLVPGAAGATAGSSPATSPARSAAATRDRFASFQRGVRQGRAAASQAASDDGEDEGSE
jgi:signal transduction histidine kinase